MTPVTPRPFTSPFFKVCKGHQFENPAQRAGECTVSCASPYHVWSLYQITSTGEALWIADFDTDEAAQTALFCRHMDHAVNNQEGSK